MKMAGMNLLGTDSAPVVLVAAEHWHDKLHA
jgi:hypothetical protein